MLSKDVNWHEDHPYLSTIQAIVPTSRWIPEIERCLLELWVQTHYDYKLYSSKDMSTLFDLDVDLLVVKTKLAEEEFKKEEDHYASVLGKLQALDTPPEVAEESSSSDDQEEMPDVQRNAKQEARIKGAPGVKTVARTLREKKLKDAQQLKALKSSLATSQQKLLELKAHAESLETKQACYTIYQAAAQFYTKAFRAIALSYKASQDDTKLIQDLDALLETYNTKMREGIPKEPCRGSGDTCETHFLPLSAVKRSPKTFEPEAIKCRISL